jgi:hypothetical protein
LVLKRKLEDSRTGETVDGNSQGSQIANAFNYGTGSDKHERKIVSLGQIANTVNVNVGIRYVPE